MNGLRRRFVSGSIVLIGASSLACGGDQKSIALFFPNESSRAATQRIVIEGYSPDTGTASSEQRTCATIERAAQSGAGAGMTTVKGDYHYPFAADEQLTQVPSGKQILRVLGFPSRDDPDAKEILRGCTDTFDSTGGSDRSEEVPVELKVVVPDEARLIVVEGDPQVVRANQDLPVPLRVRVVSSPDSGRDPYPIPGVPVMFDASFAEGVVLGLGDGTIYRQLTDENGEVTVTARSPAQSSRSFVVVTAELAEDPMMMRSESQVSSCAGITPDDLKCFSITVPEPISFQTTETTALSAKPVAVALGRITGANNVDAVVLSCEGSDGACTPGAAAMRDPELGVTHLDVISKVGVDPERIVVTDPTGLGILPAGLVTANLVPSREGGSVRDEIAIANSRRADCQGRVKTTSTSCPYWGLVMNDPCPCEGSEVLVLQWRSDTQSVVLDHRIAMTASNAVGLTAYSGEAFSANSLHRNLAIAAQGRARNDRPCLRTMRCNEYQSCTSAPTPTDPNAVDLNMCMPCDPNAPGEACGCPPEERCECPNCPSTQQMGICIPRDKSVDLLVNRWNGAPPPSRCSQQNPSGYCPIGEQPRDDTLVCQRKRGLPAAVECVPKGLYNKGGCPIRRLSCRNLKSEKSTCHCDASELGNLCAEMDGCGCKVPDRIHVGEADTPSFPYSITAGAFKSDDVWDLIVPSALGLAMLEAKTSMRTFEWESTPFINAPIEMAQAADLDGDPFADLVWASKSSCTLGSTFMESCPLLPVSLPEGGEPLGCAGVYYTNNKDETIFDHESPTNGGCHRFSLPFSPTAMCLGKLNDDNYLDLVLASDSSDKVYVLSGDGRGGLLDPPETFVLPAGAKGGPVACGDVDGDGLDDIAVASRSNLSLYVLRTGR